MYTPEEALEELEVGVRQLGYRVVMVGGLMRRDFRDFMFANAVRFWGQVNPDFFRGTVVEKAKAEVLASAEGGVA